MLLGKSCAKRHHIRNGTLRLGTLAYYRATENQEIADKGEGQYSFTVKLDGEVRVSTYWFDTLNAGLQIGSVEPHYYPGNMTAWLDKIDFVRDGPEHVKMKDTVIRIFRESPNCFVFCMSAVESLSECQTIFSGYDDCWGIAKTQAKEFCIETAKILLETLKAEYRSGKPILPEGLPGGLDIDKLSINCIWSEVMYVPRELHISEANNDTLSQFLEKMESMAFIKPPEPFAKEKEYRFQFNIMHGNYLLEPRVESIIIDAKKLARFVI